VDVCTIIAKNYVAHARVLARSLAAQDPECRLWTLIIDEFEPYIDPEREPFEVLTPAQIGCDAFTHMALRYTVLELSTAVKPWLLRHLMEVTGGPVTYLDPDIKVYGPLGHLDELAARHGVALIPHNSVPIPPDGRKPSQIDVMIAGVYNLGYVTVAPGPEVDRLLDWWADRLRRDCRVDPVWGYFVDQRWFDLVPGFLTDFAIIRDPEYNVAYWNLPSRRLEHDRSGYLVDGRPLAFFHFSGFDPLRPRVLSRHQNRIDVAEDPVLERLLAEYAKEVMGEGHAVSRRWPYSYVALGDGTEIDELVRGLCQDFADEQERNGRSAPSPFTFDGARKFHDWVATDAPDAPAGVNRVLARVYGSSLDLQERFPDPGGADREGLLAWAQEQGVHEVPLLAQIAGQGNGAGTSTGTRLPVPVQADGSTPQPEAVGLNVVGHFASAGELGEVARQIVDAYDELGIPAVPVDEPARTESDDRALTALSPADAAFGVNLICLSPDGVPEFAKHAGARFFAGRYSIALWLCAEPVGEEALAAAASLLQEIWAPSAYVTEALRPHVTVPVRTVPIPVQPPTPAPCSRSSLGWAEDRFMFLCSVDLADTLARANPVGAMKAFARAFSSDEAVQLVVACTGAKPGEEPPDELRAAAARHPGIELAAHNGARLDTLARLSLVDCCVSLHRAEAFGLSLAEAMWLGKPVIATGYSGNLEFMNRENSYLVDARPLAAGSDPGRIAWAWAEPDLEHAAQLMRETYENPAAARALGARAAADIRRFHSPYVSGSTMERRLESIRATGRVPRPLPPRRIRPRALTRAQSVIGDGPGREARGGRGRRLRGAARRTVLRALKPYTAYQEKANAAMLAAIEELGRSFETGLEELQARAALERAQLIAELRSARRTRPLPDAEQTSRDAEQTSGDAEQSSAETRQDTHPAQSSP
jgi:hypothetical protein